IRDFHVTGVQTCALPICRVYAAMKFFLYTFLGSVFMLVGLIYLYMKGGSWQIPDLVQLSLTATEQAWLFFAFLIAFAVKVPMFQIGRASCRGSGDKSIVA